jgi:Ca-activated chloride channel family protein
MNVPGARHFVTCFILSFLLIPLGWSRALPPQQSRPSTGQSSGQSSSEVTVPNRPAAPLFKGEQGKQSSEIEFAPSSRVVTLKLRVEDPNGYFLPNIRRENFAVYEDRVRQNNVNVEVEHAPVTIALLLELGGRYHELNKALAMEVAQIGRQALDVIGPQDKVAAFKYDSNLTPLADFNEGRDRLDKVFDNLSVPATSEANLYDALLATLDRMRGVEGRKAIILISTGVDTFSKATYEDALRAVRESVIPIYTISLGEFIQLEAHLYGPEAPFAHIDWNGAENRLDTLARSSGGRAYAPQTGVEVPGIYDDIMENLRVRYVITYMSSNPTTSGPPRKIRVELIDPKTGQPLKFRDSSGKPVTARIFVQETYSPKAA